MAVAQKRQRLTPGAIAEELFCLEPDRDERAAQLCAETLLTLVQNGYGPPEDGNLVTPKRQLFAVRSLALGENFLGGRDEGRAGDDENTPSEYGARLAAGREIRGSAHLELAQQTLQGLIDADTQRASQRGAWLLRPFHESLLWYDARKPSPTRLEYTVRKVYMRGSGITLARILADPADRVAAELGRSAVDAIRDALTAESPFAEISQRLERVLPADASYTKSPDIEDDERAAWDRGIDPRLARLAEQLCRHAEGVMLQSGASGPARLWQLRSILAVDLALHVARTAWQATTTPRAEQFLLLSFGGAPRAQDPVRQRSEESYRRARIRLSEATVQTLARRMEVLDKAGKRVDWPSEFQTGSSLGNNEEDSVSSQLKRLPRPSRAVDYLRVARAAVEAANYSRGAEDGFRVLLESAGALVGTGSYRYFTASPDLLAALVGALSARMPMPSREFFAAVRQEWGFVINQGSAAGTGLANQLDGAGLERNARRAERLMSEAGLALGLSDRTVIVGERAARVPQ